MIAVEFKGNSVYIIEATLLADGVKTMRVAYKGKQYFFPKAHAEMIEPGKFAVKVEFYDILFQQDLFKKTVMVKATFRRNNQKVPAPRLKRISKN